MSDAASVPDSPVERKHILDPIDRISEIIFGIIMALSFTGSLSVATAGQGEVRTMLLGALGCNTAWGIVDGVMYVLGSILQRNRTRIQIHAVRRATDAAIGRRLLAAGLPGALGQYMLPEELERLRSVIATDQFQPPKPGVTGEDLLGAAAIFFLCFLSTLPVALPFALIHDPAAALRTSNVIAMSLLFFGGYRLGRFAGLSPWKFGGVMLLIGVILVLVTLILGG